MAKYLDNDGLSHFLAKLRLTFSKIGHTHSITPTMRLPPHWNVVVGKVAWVGRAITSAMTAATRLV